MLWLCCSSTVTVLLLPVGCHRCCSSPALIPTGCSSPSTVPVGPLLDISQRDHLCIPPATKTLTYQLNIEGWRAHNLSGKIVPVLHHSHRKEFLPVLNYEWVEFSLFFFAQHKVRAQMPIWSFTPITQMEQSINVLLLKAKETSWQPSQWYVRHNQSHSFLKWSQLFEDIIFLLPWTKVCPFLRIICIYLRDVIQVICLIRILSPWLRLQSTLILLEETWHPSFCFFLTSPGFSFNSKLLAIWCH